MRTAPRLSPALLGLVVLTTAASLRVAPPSIRASTPCGTLASKVMAGTSPVSFTDEQGIEYGLWSTPDYLTGSPHGVGMLVGVVARSRDGKAQSRIFPGLESGGVACLSFSSRLRKTAANQDTVVFISSVIDTASYDGRPGSVVVVCKLPDGQQHPPGMRPKVVVKPAECGEETELSIQALSPGAAERVKAALEKPGPWFPCGLTECCRTTSDST